MAFYPTAPTTVFVAKPFEISYADAMRGLRTWLDHRQVQPAGFKIARNGKIGFEITFLTEQDALTFGSFEWLPC
jgi:hypothetical protein